MASSESPAISHEQRWAAAFFALLLTHCGPYHEGGGSGGSSPAGGSASGGSASGGSASGGSAGAGASAATSGSTTMAGSTGSGSSAGSAGQPTSAANETVIGCEPTRWPDDGFFFEGPAPGEPSTRAEALLSRFSPDGISGNGKLVVGHTDDPTYALGIPLTWSLADGVVEPPSYGANYTYATQASCDGSVILLQGADNLAYRVQGEQAPVQIFSWAPPGGSSVYANPNMSIIVNSFGTFPDTGHVPVRWTTTNPFEVLYDLTNQSVHGVWPDGSLLAADEDALYHYDAALTSRTAVGMAPVDRGEGWRSFSPSADGKAWVQSADLHYDSFLVWHLGSEPRSVTCPNPCRILDVSGTGQVVLLDVQLEPDVSTASSWIWTEQSGLVDLAELFERSGFFLGGRKVLAAALSDDGRAITGRLWAPPPAPWSQYLPFFYAVLPTSAYATTSCSGQPEGTACDDGQFCTQHEVCDGNGMCGGGQSPCNEYVPGIPRCNEAERMCEICTDGRALVNGECRCPFWNCLARGGATYCSETDVSEENQVGCFYDGLTLDDLPPLP